VAAEGVPFGDARAPVRRPTGVERMVATGRLFLSQEEGRLDAVPGERIGNQFGVPHVAGVKGQVQGARLASRRGVCRGRGQQQHAAAQQRQDSGQEARAHGFSGHPC
jgi:hypothetical protein